MLFCYEIELLSIVTAWTRFGNQQRLKEKQNLQAFATAWAGGITCDDSCTVEADAATSTIETILVNAASSAYTSFCASAFFPATVLQAAHVFRD